VFLIFTHAAFAEQNELSFGLTILDRGLHGGVVVSTVVSLGLGPFCVEFACSPRAVTLASSHCPKTCMLG